METIQNKSNLKNPAIKRHTGLRIDMTPMVDVAMLLMTFFMLTAVFSKPQAMELILPKDKNPIPVSENKLVTLFIDHNSKIYTQNGNSSDIFHLPFEKLRNELINLKNRKPDIVALIKIDRRARYQSMVDILDELNCTEIDKFSFAPFTEKDKLKLEDIRQKRNPI
ncbi:MAG: biopolymer transporter ExbD [Bacteroidetes bacterium]|nr:biopolymer transporter ExbD [Bacteroidota bacterium]